MARSVARFVVLLAVPAVAMAHGEEALVLGLLLPVSVVPALFLLSVWFWRADAGTKIMSATLILLIGAGAFAFNLTVLRWMALYPKFWDRVLEVLWFAWPPASQAAAWALFARWHRQRVRKAAVDGG